MTDSVEYPVWTLPRVDEDAVQNPADVTWRQGRVLMDLKNKVLRVGDGVTQGGLPFYPGRGGFISDLSVTDFTTSINGGTSEGSVTCTSVPGYGADIRIPRNTQLESLELPYYFKGIFQAIQADKTWQVTYKTNAYMVTYQTWYPGLQFLSADKTHIFSLDNCYNGNEFRYKNAHWGVLDDAGAIAQTGMVSMGNSQNLGSSLVNGFPDEWYRVVFDGTNFTIYTSEDGVRWHWLINSYQRIFDTSTVLGGAPAYLGFGALVYQDLATQVMAPLLDDVFGTVTDGYRLMVPYFKFEYLT